MRKCSAALLVVAACAAAREQPRTIEPGEAQQRLVKAEQAGDPARAGFLRYLIASDEAGARKLLEQSQEPLALCGLAELAENRLDTLQAAQLWARVLRDAPTDPLAELAALRLLDVEGESSSVDELITATAKGLEVPAAPRAARLLREAAARIASRAAAAQGKPELEVEAWRAMGVVQHWRAGGPFGALRLFDLSRAFALDGPAPQAAARFDRALDFPDGDLGLEQEPGEGDVYFAASEVTLARGGDYLLWVEGAAALEVRLDGEARVSRAPWPREVPRAQTAAVRLPPGKHALLARWSRSEGNRFRITLVRADGAASDLQSAAPAELRGARTGGACALGTACLAAPAWQDKADLRAAARALLEKDPGDPLAAFLLTRSLLGDDRAASRAAVEQLVLTTNSGAPALALRAQQLLHDPEVPERLGRARALQDLASAVAKDPQLLRAQLTAAALQRDSERFDDAAASLQQAVTALGPQGKPPARLLAAQARLADARGNAAKARGLAEEARTADPGRCDSVQLLYDLARRDGALADQQRLSGSLLACPDGLSTAATLARERGELLRAEELYARSAALRPALPNRLEQLAEVQEARKELDAAEQSLRKAAQLAPRSSEPLRRLAGFQELFGNARGATGTRAQALLLAPGDLNLRQQVSLDRHEKLLGWSDRDALKLASDKTVSAPPGASAVRLLDHGSAQLFPDGGGVERAHTLLRVLDKKGVSKFGEAQIPGDAQLLHLRTLKADGRILEPESIPEKEGISMPGLEPGDAVEIDYLRGLAPRGPELPGWTLGGFYFRDEDTPMGVSSYDVLAPGPLEVDAHGLTLPKDAVTQEGANQHLHYEAHDVAPAQPEPHQPGEAELMPWLQVGTGAGQRELVKSVADWALLRARPSSSTEELARKAGGGTPREKAQNIWAAVAQAVRGRSNGYDFATSAAHVLAQGRGNRLVVVRAALAAAGIPSRIVMVRTFGSDPGSYRFPRGELYGYAVLRIDLPEGPLWADASFRLAPLGQLPAFVRGQPGFVVPEPGEEPSEVRTPAEPLGPEGREVRLDVALDATGSATGKGRDLHRAFEAAGLKDALERLDRDQRRQAVESMLGRGLPGVTLEALATEGETEVGGEAALDYGVKLQLARRDGEQLYVPSSVLPARLQRRWAPKSDRSVTLLLDSPEETHVRASVALPAGAHVKAPPAPVKLDTPFGQYRWLAREEAGKLVIDESLTLKQQRITPAQYPAFVDFARAVDAAQSQELLVAP